MAGMLTGPSRSKLADARLSSALRCSRRRQTVASFPKYLEVQSLGAGAGYPTSAGTATGAFPPPVSSFLLPSPAAVAAAVMGMSWYFPAGYSFQTQRLSAAIEDTTWGGYAGPPTLWPVLVNPTPPYTPPEDIYEHQGSYDGGGGPVSYIEPFAGLFNVTTGLWNNNYWTQHLHDVTEPYWQQYGFGLTQFWMYWPNLFGDTTSGSPLEWQNTLIANRGRYRVDNVCACFEGACELWADWTSPNPTWGAGVDTGQYQYYATGRTLTARNWTFRNRVAITPFTLGAGSTNTTSAWNYVGSSSAFIPSSLSPVGSPTAMDGFVGMMVFHVFEDPFAWEARTGITLAGLT